MEEKLRALIEKWRRRARKLDEHFYGPTQKIANVEIDTLNYCADKLERVLWGKG